MSLFLPEETPRTTQDGVASVTPANPETTAEDIALMQRMLAAAARNPNLIPPDFMAYVLDYIQTGRLQIPIGQVFGFQRFVSTQVSAAPAAIIITPEATTATAYGNLATVGPSLSALADGKYVVMYGCAPKVTAGEEAGMSISINGGAVDDNDACIGRFTDFQSVSIAVAKTLSNGGTNTIVAKYHSLAGASVTFARRWLLAVRYDNV